MYNYQTQIFGITGHPLGHTNSPLIHNSLMEMNHINGVYLVFQLEHPDKNILKSMYTLGIRGLSVTIPHKEWAYQAADEHDEISRAMKASNTLLLKKDVVKAYNTDGPGALEAIHEYTGSLLSSAKTGNTLIIGSGGSARGIAWSLAAKNIKGKKIILTARNQQTALQLVKDINLLKPGCAEFIPLDEVEKETKNISLIIQTTPVGMKGREDNLILPASFFTKDQFLFDIVYNPVKTSLVKTAMKKGTKIIPGYEMLLYQAFRQFELFTGTKPSKSQAGKVRKKLVSQLNKIK